MKIIDIPGGQGSEAWHRHRRDHFGASDAPAMLGCSPWKTRAQLLREQHTGLAPGVDATTQRRFDDGHRFEALARPLAETIVGDDLYPITVAAGRLSASLDGATMDGKVLFEHKTLSQELRECMEGEDEANRLPLHYRAQMEQQLHCSGGERVLFMATKWDNETLVEERHCWYYPDLALREQLVRGWTQFERDLADYVPPERAAPVVAEAMEALPAVSVRLDGQLVVRDNLEAFGKALRAFVEKIPKAPSNDNEFATCEAACKSLKDAEERLQATEDVALSSMADVNSMRTAVATLRDLARQTRLASEKLVKARKEQIREEECRRGRQAVDEHVQALNARLGQRLMPMLAFNFPEAIKGLKTLDSVRNAIDTELARVKIESSATADRIDANLKAITAVGAPSLFPDTQALVLKAADDLAAVIAQRLAVERQRQDAERERIRAEEAARIERERQIEEAARQRAEQERAVSTLPGTPGQYAGNVAQAAQATPSGARDGAHAEQCAPVSYSPPGTRSAPAAPETPPTLNVSAINARLGFTLTSDFITNTLRITPAGKSRQQTPLWHESAMEHLCAGLAEHVLRIGGAA